LGFEIWDLKFGIWDLKFGAWILKPETLNPETATFKTDYAEI
jgi:hypothetical protein